MVQPLWKTVWRYLRKLNIELPYEPGMPLLGIYPDGDFIEKDTCPSMFIAALFTIAKTWKQPKCPSTEEWIQKMWYIYTMEYYSEKNKTKQRSKTMYLYWDISIAFLQVNIHLCVNGKESFVMVLIFYNQLSCK